MVIGIGNENVTRSIRSEAVAHVQVGRGRGAAITRKAAGTVTRHGADIACLVDPPNARSGLFGEENISFAIDYDVARRGGDRGLRWTTGAGLTGAPDVGR